MEPILATTGVVVVEAPLGFGKSCLAAELLATPSSFDASSLAPDAIDDAWRRAGCPATVVWDDACIGLNDDFEFLHRDEGRSVLLARAPLELARQPTLALRGGDLLFDQTETEQLAAARAVDAPELLAHLVVSRTGGWPAHAAAALMALDSQSVPPERYANFLDSQTARHPLAD
ncbi:MAG: hypothetical protein AAFN30_20105, partial [Actinomycetota bacterium]